MKKEIDNVISELLNTLFNSVMYLTLHMNVSGSFPPPLKASEEKRYLELMKNGDENARSKLIEHNLRLVAHIIKKYYSSYSEQEDLISIGTIGLIKGINSFDCDKGSRLATYVARCIENEILMHFRSNKKNNLEVSMSDPLESDSDGNELTLMDIICSDENMIDDIDIKIRSEQLYKYLAEIDNKREREILILRYGLNCTKPLTQREIAKKLNISRSYVSRLEKRGIEKLRKMFNVDIN